VSHIQEQVDYVRAQKPFKNAPRRVLVIGASTGYGLASRIVAAIGGHADTFGIFYERPGEDNKTASAGWYNSVAFEKVAQAYGVKAFSMNGDAFSKDFKNKAVKALKEKMGPVDCIIYSLAAPQRVDVTGDVYKSVLKPVGRKFSGKTVNTDKSAVFETTLEPATEDEIFHTKKVMGGEDWEAWVRLLEQEKLLANGVTALAYSYVGPEITWPIYRDGTIGRAKDHLAQTAETLNRFLHQQLQGRALISVNKAVVTQASSAIPVVPLYISILFKIMKAKGLHEDCIQQMYRLFAALFDNPSFKKESETCIRLDNLELLPEVQSEVNAIWQKISSNNLLELSDFREYQENFLKLFGFGFKEVDYERDVDPKRTFLNLVD
jgi:enoyl-[acyl-carrier protein] reductase/trans-2-enoyl-CoA reductase (NAD+)